MPCRLNPHRSQTLPAVSFFEGFQTPAGPEKTRAHSCGRHLKPITRPVVPAFCNPMRAKEALGSQSGLFRKGENNSSLSCGPRDFHPQALPEPCMTLSSHAAPDVRPHGIDASEPRNVLSSRAARARSCSTRNRYPQSCERLFLPVPGCQGSKRRAYSHNWTVKPVAFSPMQSWRCRE